MGRGGFFRGVGVRLWLSAGWLLLLALAALFAPLIAPQDPLAQDLLTSRLPPFWQEGAEPGYWLGTDNLGRDVLSRMIYGARVALTVALIAASATCVIGSTLGILAGYFGGWVDNVISRAIDMWMAFPPVLFAILLIAVIGTGMTSIIVAIIIIDWTRFARVIRIETLTQSSMDYNDAAIIAGASSIRILWREILPNILPTLTVLLSMEMSIAVVVEAILSFVNLSIPTDDPTWGGMIAEGRISIHQAWWVLVFPMVILFMTVLGFSQLGEGLKDKFDPVLR